MLSLSEDIQIYVIEASDSISGYLDDLLNIDNDFFDSMIKRFYPSEFQLNKAYMSDSQIPMPRFWIYIYLYRMVLLSLKFMINEMILISEFSISGW